MKTLIILGDGMADEPIKELGGKTPLEFAQTPYMDRLAAEGITGRLQTVPKGFHPGSEVANMAVLGYDLNKTYEGRGVLEAASIGYNLKPGEMAMRCNLICIEGDKIKNHSAGHITTAEAKELIKTLNKELGSNKVHFYTGVSYRHLLIIQNGNKSINCTPPHDVPLHPFKQHLIKSEVKEADETAKLLNDLIIRSQQILEKHPMNLKRIAEGKDPANSIWPWSPGYRPEMCTMKEMYGIKQGSVISAVDLIKGIGRYAGLKIINVKGATGLYDTNYEGKAQAALEALKNDDFVYLHIEASDEAGHEGNAQLKVKTIEYLENRIVKPIYETIKMWNEPVAIAILPDHPTPCSIKTHTSKPVPFLMYKPYQTPDKVTCFNESSVLNGKYQMLYNNEFIKELLK